MNRVILKNRLRLSKVATSDRIKVENAFPTFIKEAPRLQITLENRALIPHLHLRIDTSGPQPF